MADLTASSRSFCVFSTSSRILCACCTRAWCTIAFWYSTLICDTASIFKTRTYWGERKLWYLCRPVYDKAPSPFCQWAEGRSRQSLLLWRPSGPVHSSKMSFPDMISNESEIYTDHANKTPDSNVQNEINVQSIPARRSVWLWRWWQWWWWRLITQFYKTYSHFPSKKPSNAIVSFMKVCKRTPPSKMPLTFHRRVGRGNGERGVERKRREGGRRNYKKYLELCKIPLRLDPEKMDNREERDSGLFPN